MKNLLNNEQYKLRQMRNRPWGPKITGIRLYHLYYYFGCCSCMQMNLAHELLRLCRTVWLYNLWDWKRIRVESQINQSCVSVSFFLRIYSEVTNQLLKCFVSCFSLSEFIRMRREGLNEFTTKIISHPSAIEQ